MAGLEEVDVLKMPSGAISIPKNSAAETVSLNCNWSLQPNGSNLMQSTRES